MGVLRVATKTTPARFLHGMQVDRRRSIHPRNNLKEKLGPRKVGYPNGGCRVVQGGFKGGSRGIMDISRGF